jgi:HEAT repeat protein
MNRSKLLSIAMLTILLFGCHCWLAQWCRAAEPSFKELLDQLLPGMGAPEIADRKEPQQKFQAACYAVGAPGREAQRAEARKLIAERLGPETAKPARLWLLKQLEVLGHGECVAAIAAQLDDKDPEIFDAARRALENNPAPEANAALLKALETARDAGRRVALTNSLGERRDSASVTALAKMLGGPDKAINPDEAVMLAAANALGKIGGDEARAALWSAGRFTANQQLVIGNANLRIGENLVKEGKGDESVNHYNMLGLLHYPRSVLRAARQRILRAAGDKAAPMLLTMLASEDGDARAIAAGYVGSISDPAAIKRFTTELPKLPASGQSLLLCALATRGDKSAMPAAVAAAKSDNQQVKIAALQSLAKLGDASVVPLLIEAVAAGGEAASTARESLQQVWGKGVDEAIAATMKKAEPPMRDTLLDVVEQRGAVAAAPSLLEFVQGPDAKLRDRAMKALGKLAGPENVPAMVKVLLSMEKGTTRDEAEKAIMFACGRSDEEANQAEPVLAALAEASDAQRVILLPLLGRIGGKKALVAIQAAMKSPSAEIREAGIRGLCNWPDASVADELLALAQNADSSAHRTWALRAYIRVTSLGGKRSPRQSLAMFKKAMELITRDDERKLLLGRVSEVRDMAALRFVVPYLDNPALASEASRAVVDLARRRELFDPHQAEFTAALKKVTEVCKDQRLVDQAKRIMAGL